MARTIIWNLAGFRELRTQPGLKADVLNRAQRIAEEAGEGIEAFPSETVTRARAVAITVDGVGVGRNAREHVLLKSIDAGRG